MTAVVVAGAVVVAAAAWYVLFGRGRDQLWSRTWLVSAVLIAYSVLALGALGRLREVLGPVGPAEVGIGIAAGIAWLVATHVGHAVLARLFPSFVDQIRGLYDLGAGEPASRVIGPLLVMAVAEELLFRGVVQGEAGFVVGVIVYVAVQAVERNWALVLAAFLGGMLWGALFAVTDGLVAPVLAHALWTVTLTLVWPLGGRGDRPIGPIRSETHSTEPTNTPSEGRHG